MEESVAFAKKIPTTSAMAQQLFWSLSRGYALLVSALEWDKPTVGRSAHKSSEIRGVQWRLVIAWSGLEQILGQLAHSKGFEDIQPILSACELPSYPPLAPPHRNQEAINYWRALDQEDNCAGINWFLQSGKTTKRVLNPWLIAGQPIQSWTEAMMLAQVLRHITAHGALSATKVREWGLRNAFLRLLPEMGIVATAIFSRMSAECERTLGDTAIQPVVRHNRALSLPPPQAEAVVRGLTARVARRQRTTTFGRVYIYASHKKLHSEEENSLLAESGIELKRDVKFRQGIILGTVEIHECTCDDGVYYWHLKNPERWSRPKLPERKPQGTWFTPFNQVRGKAAK